MTIREKLERIMMAIAFAEAGEHETARKLMKKQKQTHWKRTVVPRKSRQTLRAPRL